MSTPLDLQDLHALDNFKKGDLGCVTGDRVSKITGLATLPINSFLVMAFEDVQAGKNGRFERPGRGLSKA